MTTPIDSMTFEQYWQSKLMLPIPNTGRKSITEEMAYDSWQAARAPLEAEIASLRDIADPFNVELKEEVNALVPFRDAIVNFVGEHEDIESPDDALRAFTKKIPILHELDRENARMAAIGQDLERNFFAAELTIAELSQSLEKAEKDVKRIQAIQDNSWDVRSRDLPTAGGDDAEIGWTVIEHNMGKTSEVVVGENYSDDVRAAIDAALSQQSSGEVQS